MSYMRVVRKVTFPTFEDRKIDVQRPKKKEMLGFRGNTVKISFQQLDAKLLVCQDGITYDRCACLRALFGG